jgi:hypothetical protein
LNGTNGEDALLLDDGAAPGLFSIETIDMGLGDDVVDLTSRRYSYGDVTIEGGGGDDVLWADAGNDVLDGGRGDDALAGGAGNDVYVHRTTDGDDLVTESSGDDAIAFGAGIAPPDVAVGRHGNDLVLAARANGSVTVAGWFGDAGRRVESVRFADGTVWREAELSMRANARGHEHEDFRHEPLRHGANSAEEPRDRDDQPRDGSQTSGAQKPTDNAANIIATLLGKQPAYDFSALTDYLSRQHDEGAARPLTPAEISRQWAALQRFTARLVDHPHAAEAAHGDGYADDLLRVAPSAVGLGFDGSTGTAPAQAGMKPLDGLTEGFKRLA